MKYWYYIVLVVFLASCKSKAVLVDTNTKPILDENAMTAQKVIENHYNNKSDFSTLYIRSSAKYSDEKQSQNVSAEIKIKKNEKILVSIRVLGITLAKALITPKEVKYYEKINGTYFEGDYASLSEWLGTDLDFSKVQNMLLGRPIDDLTKQDYIYHLIDKLYALNTVENDTGKTFLFEPQNFLLRKQVMDQSKNERRFEVNYSNYQNFAAAVLPSNLDINAMQKKGKTAISIEYNTITFNEELSFPYSVPDGYERIFIN
ncbi:DUF4292 domain-containing protein [Flavobacterium terrisoli]|uniref:DUF4292 domain-containing protein n=1 Tax=Flavobacterium terrisoli TaxID=3242195 RepID=UPI002542F226|nr:DUF4292 domain-containing protein [Flavobacterium buctense]